MARPFKYLAEMLVEKPLFGPPSHRLVPVSGLIKLPKTHAQIANRGGGWAPRSGVAAAGDQVVRGLYINARARTHTTRGGLDVVDGVAT